MKQILLLILLLSGIPTFAQETKTYQSDHIYKVNKVKVRKWYQGQNITIGPTTFYDRAGRLVKYEIKLNLGTSTRTTHYKYNQSGKLISMVDSTKNSKPNK